MVVDGLGFSDPITSFIMEPVVADHDVRSGAISVAAGCCVGMRQVATAASSGREVVRLELEMVLGLEGPADEIHIAGRPPVDMVIDGGIAGDPATAAVVVAAAKTITSAPSGLRTMPELQLSRPLGTRSTGAGEPARV